MSGKEAAKESVATASKLYLQSQVEQERAHSYLKQRVRQAKEDGLTQQEIADATQVREGDVGFSLSRQRISQIVNGE